MKEEFTISVFEDDLNKLTSLNINAKEFIDTVFLDEENIEVLQTCCLYHYKFKPDNTDIIDFKIRSATYDQQQSKGSITCNFTVEEADRQLSNSSGQNIKWDFKVDTDELMIQFTSQDVPIHEP